MSLLVDVEQRLGTFELAARFESAGRLTALFGPSGSGKTSIINMIGGLARPRRGLIRADDRVLVDTARGLALPAHKRRIGYVFQDSRLFPHMTVAQNLKYGRWFSPAGERYADMDAIVEMLGIGALLDRRPAALSGGEMQRVSIGRALLASPRLMLMDEPLSSLDDSRKQEIMPYIERLRDETRIPIVYVSHSIAEVARLATDIVVLSQGKVLISGSTAEVMRRPDLLPVEDRSEGGAVIEAAVARQDADNLMTVLSSQAGDLVVPAIDAPAGTGLRVRIRARDVMVATERPRGLSALNVLAGTVQAVRSSGPGQMEIDIACGDALVVARITKQSTAALELAEGRPVFAVIKTVSFERPTAAPRL